MAEISPELGGGILGGLIAAFVLMLQWAKDRFGKPATNQALDIASKTLTLLAEFKESIDAFKDATIAQTEESLSARTAAAVRDEAIVAALAALKDSNTSQHVFALGAIQAIPSVIEPTIKGLTAQHAATEKSNKGLQRVMNDAMTTQNKTNGEILKALKRIQESLDELKEDNAERIEKIEQDVNALRVDVEKQSPPEFIAPIESQKPTITIEQKETTDYAFKSDGVSNLPFNKEPKPETEEKDK